MSWAVKVIDNEGEERYVCDTAGRIVRFRSRKEAKETVDFLKMGIADEVQSINVIRFRALQQRRVDSLR